MVTAPPWAAADPALTGYPAGNLSYPLGYPPPDPPPPTEESWMGFEAHGRQPRWGIPDIFLGLACWIVVQIIFAIGAVLVTGSEKGVVVNTVALVGSWVGMVGYLVFISRFKGLGSLRADFGWRFKWIDPVIGLGAGIVTIFVSVGVRYAVAAAFGSEPAGNAEQIFGGAQNNKAAVVVLALMAAIGAPIVEELFFRGLALRAVERRLGAIVGVMAPSLLFALLHWQGGPIGGTLSLVSGILVYGTIFAIVTRWTGRLGPSIFAHMTINSIASALLLYSVFTCGTISC